MRIQHHMGKYRLIDTVNNDSSPLGSNGSLVTLGDYATDGVNLYRKVSKIERVELLSGIVHRVNGVYIIYQPHVALVVIVDEHILFVGEASTRGKRTQTLELSDFTVYPDGTIIKRMD